MGNRDQPNRTHMVTWVTNMASMEGKKMDVVQCDIREGTKRHRKTMRWLIGVSYLMPVNIVQGQACELWAYGRKIIEWDQDDFVHLEYDKGGRIIGGRVVPRAHVLQGDEDTEKWADTVARGIQVEEIDPVYREAQLRYMKTVADERSKK